MNSKRIYELEKVTFSLSFVSLSRVRKSFSYEKKVTMRSYKTGTRSLYASLQVKASISKTVWEVNVLFDLFFETSGVMWIDVTYGRSVG